MVVVLFALALAAPFRLADLLREARDRNPELKAAAARAHAATESISPAGALEDPMLMVQVWNAPVDLSSIPVMIQLTQPRVRMLPARTSRSPRPISSANGGTSKRRLPRRTSISSSPSGRWKWTMSWRVS